MKGDFYENNSALLGLIFGQTWASEEIERARENREQGRRRKKQEAKQGK